MEIIDKETWINSRTNNPDRLGKEVWGAMYDHLVKGVNASEEETKKLTPLFTEVTKDFFAKIGCEYSQDDIRRAFNSEEARIAILANMLTPALYSKDHFKYVIDAVMRQVIKANSDGGNGGSSEKSSSYILAAAAKKLSGRG